MGKGTMDRLMMSAPDWWIEQMKARADEVGLSLAGLIRVTCVQGWSLARPENDKTGRDGDDDDE